MSTFHARSATTLKAGKITYSVEVLQRKNARKLSPLELELLRQNTPSQRMIYFDGQRSCMQEQSNDYGFYSMTTVLREAGSSTYKYVKPFPFLHVWFEMTEQPPIQTQPFPTVVKLLNGKKEILGYQCRKASIEKEHVEYIVWYTTELVVSDPTKAVFQEDSVPGLILEVEEYLKGDVPWYKKYTVSALNQELLDKSVFELPKDAVQLKNADEADVRNRALLEEAAKQESEQHPYPDDQKERFLDTWVRELENDAVELTISRGEKDDEYLVTEVLVFDGKRMGPVVRKGRFYGPRLLVEQSPNYHTFVLTDEGKLRMEQHDFYTFHRGEARH